MYLPTVGGWGGCATFNFAGTHIGCVIPEVNAKCSIQVTNIRNAKQRSHIDEPTLPRSLIFFHRFSEGYTPPFGMIMCGLKGVLCGFQLKLLLLAGQSLEKRVLWMAVLQLIQQSLTYLESTFRSNGCKQFTGSKGKRGKKKKTETSTRETAESVAIARGKQTSGAFARNWAVAIRLMRVSGSSLFFSCALSNSASASSYRPCASEAAAWPLSSSGEAPYLSDNS